MGGFSLDSLSADQVLGFSVNPRTTDNFDMEKHLPNPSTNTSNYYTSQAWETTITNAKTNQDQPSDETPEGRPSISNFYFCTTNP